MKQRGGRTEMRQDEFCGLSAAVDSGDLKTVIIPGRLNMGCE